MHKTELTPAELRAYRRLARAAREVEQLEIQKRVHGNDKRESVAESELNEGGQHDASR